MVNYWEVEKGKHGAKVEEEATREGVQNTLHSTGPPKSSKLSEEKEKAETKTVPKPMLL